MVADVSVRRLAMVLTAFGLCAGTAHAESFASPWFDTDQGRVRLVAGVTSVGAADIVPLGLEFELKPHWKIYWRSPGDAGYPPHLDWAGSENLKSASIGWPAPKRFSVLGLETVGYEDHVVLPVSATLAKAGDALKVEAALAYLTCNDICIPYDTTLALDVPPGDGAPSPLAGLLARFIMREPRHEQTHALAVTDATARGGARTELELRVHAEPPLVHPDVFVDAPQGLAFGAPRIGSGATREETVLRLPVAGTQGDTSRLTGRRIAVTLVDGDRALEVQVAPSPAAAPNDPLFLLRIVGLALLGGFILNFMPCVLPVLSLKLIGVAGAGGKARRQARLGFLASAAGVIAAFLVLAVATIALREAGLAVGWGMQFQQPMFLVFMIALVTLFAANLWDLFEVPLPGAIADWGGTGVGSGWLASFVAGVFATLLATPCSAPFLGTAIGFALAAGDGEIAIVFLALGIGLAAPYLLIAAAPGLVSWLPRPGRWMVILRRVLGIALAATAIWLAFVLAAESGFAAAAAVALLMVCVPAVLFWLRRFRTSAPALAALVALAFFVPTVLPPPPKPAVAADNFWRPLDVSAIGALVGQGKTVFVDVTADWCLTCKLNEQLAMGTPSVKAKLEAPNVVAMRGDWTRPDPAIADYLRGFGRYGIPFNAVYGPALPDGKALPELLTPDAVENAVREAREGG